MNENIPPTSQQYCVRWNSHLSSLGASMDKFLTENQFLDATIFCQTEPIRCHRTVVASCSPYFHRIIFMSRSSEPTIILPESIQVWQMKALLAFMYRGEVTVSLEGFKELVVAAKLLEIQGLCDADLTLFNAQSSTATTNASASSNDGSGSAAASASEKACPVSSQTSSTTTQSQMLEHMALNGDSFTGSTGGASRTTSPLPFVPDASSTPLPARENTSFSSSSSSSSKGGLVKAEATASSMECGTEESEHRSTSENQHHLIEAQQLPSAPLSLMLTTPPSGDHADFSSSSLLTVLRSASSSSSSSSQSQSVTITKDSMPPSSTSSSLSLDPVIYNDYSDVNVVASSTVATVDSSVADICHVELNETDCPITASTNESYDEMADIYVVEEVDEQPPHSDDCVAIEDDVSISAVARPSSMMTTAANATEHGKIRVKSKENLFGTNGIDYRKDYRVVPRKRARTTISETSNSSNSLLRSLHFNGDSMTVFMKSSLSTTPTSRASATSTTTKMSIRDAANKYHAESPQSSALEPEQLGLHYEDENDEEMPSGGVDEIQLMTNGDFEATETIKTEYNAIDDENYENIECSPNVLEIFADGGETTSQDNVTAECFGDVKILGSFYAHSVNSPHELLQYHQHMNVGNGGRGGSGGSGGGDESYSSHYGNGGDAYESYSSHYRGGRLPYEADSIEEEENKDDYGDGGGSGRRGNSRQQMHLVNSRQTNGKLKSNYMTSPMESDSGGKRGVGANMKRMNQMAEMDCCLDAMVLRNPRSNQPRSYDRKALHLALMDVKNGNSIYRASQEHHVPRKTLRNWMKRLKIKSAYPMPRQLKQAAEKRKRMQTASSSSSASASASFSQPGSSGYSHQNNGHLYQQQPQQQPSSEQLQRHNFTSPILLNESSQQSHRISSSSSFSINTKNIFDKI